MHASLMELLPKTTIYHFDPEIYQELYLSPGHNILQMQFISVILLLLSILLLLPLIKRNFGGGYVFAGVVLCVWLLVGLLKNLLTDFDEIFWLGWYKEHFIRYWKSSTECRPLPGSNSIITTDWIFMKILPEIGLGTRKSPLNFGSYQESTDLYQGPATTLIITAHHIFIKILAEVYLGTRKSVLDLGSQMGSEDLCWGPKIPHQTSLHDAPTFKSSLNFHIVGTNSQVLNKCHTPWWRSSFSECFWLLLISSFLLLLLLFYHYYYFRYCSITSFIIVVIVVVVVVGILIM